MDYECQSGELSPSVYALSTFLSAFIGSIITGITSGGVYAFITASISWVAVVRVLCAALVEFRQTFRAGTDMTAAEEQAPKFQAPTSLVVLGNANPRTHPTDDDSYFNPRSGDANGKPRSNSTEIEFNFEKVGNLSARFEKDITTLGWLGWIWSALYVPVSQTIWIAVNFGKDRGTVTKFARAWAISISALPLTYDNKQRYGAALGRLLGPQAFVAFNLWNATACLMLGVECAMLIIKGALEVDLPGALVAAYFVVSCFWAWLSFRSVRVANGCPLQHPEKANGNSLVGALLGTASLVSAPAFLLWITGSWGFGRVSYTRCISSSTCPATAFLWRRNSRL